MNTTIHSTGTENTLLMGRILGEMLSPGAIVVLTGPLGAGKTVIAKGIALGLGIETPIVSPSYTIAAEYSGSLPLTHIDLYRTDSDEELELLGFDELTRRDGVTLIEWGEKANNFLNAGVIKITVTIRGENERRIDITDISEDFYTKLNDGLTGAGL